MEPTATAIAVCILFIVGTAVFFATIYFGPSMKSYFGPDMKKDWRRDRD